MKRIQSNEYFDAVKEYFADHKVPSSVYRFLPNLLREDDCKLSDGLLFQNIDTLETTDDCFRFYTGSEVILVLCSEPKG